MSACVCLCVAVVQHLHQVRQLQPTDHQMDSLSRHSLYQYGSDTGYRYSGYPPSVPPSAAPSVAAPSPSPYQRVENDNEVFVHDPSNGARY